MNETLLFLERISEQIPASTKKLLGALILFVCIDYMTGICVAIHTQKLSSKIGAKGLSTKVMIFAMVTTF